MKANELQIGDWVIPHVFDSTLEPSKIVGIHYNSYKGKDYTDLVDCEVWDELSLYDIAPIPLTTEILKNNGFKTEDDVHFSIQGQSNTLELLLVEAPFNGFTFDIVRTEKTINKCNQRCYIDRYFASIDYVHQLQHTLRICGIEKEIVL